MAKQQSSRGRRPRRPAIALFRVSSNEQEDGFSLDSQEREGLAYADRHNLELRKTWRGVESAWKEGRKTLAEAIDYLADHPDIEILLFEKTDRMSRNSPEHEQLKRIVKSGRCEIHLFKAGRILTQDSPPADWFLQNMEAAVAQLQSDTISTEVKKAYLEKAKQGRYPGHSPFMYVTDPAIRNIRPERERPGFATFVQMAELYATGRYSLSQIEELAWERGLRSYKGNRIRAKSWHDYFRNSAYAGRFWHAGVLWDGTYETIWSMDLHRRLQRARRRHGKEGWPGWGKKKAVKFAGLGRCAHPECPSPGTALTADGPKKNNPDFIYYRCAKHSRPSIRQDRLGQKLGEIFRQLEIPADAVQEVADEISRDCSAAKAEADGAAKALTQEQQRLQRLIDTAYEDKVAGTISAADWARRTDGWRERLDDIETQLGRLQPLEPVNPLSLTRLLELTQKLPRLYDRANLTDKRRILDFAIQNFGWDGVTLSPVWASPLDEWAKAATYPFWYPRRDSNP